MNPGAGVSSLDALHEWHGLLVQFQTEAGNALTALALALQRRTQWLAEQGAYWQRQIRAAEEAVTRAQTELRNRRFAGFTGEPPDTTVQELALRRARARLAFAEERVEAVRHWFQRLPREINDTCEGPTRQLGFFLETDFANALAALARQLNALEEYANLAPRPGPSPAPPRPQQEQP